VLRHFGGGLFQMPHGLTVDDAGNAWVTDNAAKDGRGRQVYKFSPDGKILMTLGKARGGEAPEGLFQPNAIAIASIPNPSRATPAAYAYNPDCEKGIRFGRLEDAGVLGLIPDQQPMSVSSRRCRCRQRWQRFRRRSRPQGSEENI
jgi:NHL repeat